MSLEIHATELEQLANELGMEVIGVRTFTSPQRIKLKFHSSGQYTLLAKNIKGHWMYMHLGQSIAGNPKTALLRLQIKIKNCS